MATENSKVKAGVPFHYHETIIKLGDALRKSKFIDRVEYCYTDDVTENGVDFDNLFIKRDDSLSVSSDGEGLIILDHKGKALDPEKSIINFKSKIEAAMRSLEISTSIKRRDKSNVIEVAYYTNGWKMGANRRFVFDTIFCLEILFREDIYKLYVPASQTGQSDAPYWTLLKNADVRPAIVEHGNRIQRWAVRFQRALAQQDSSLKVLPPNIYEQAIHHLKKQTGVEFWREDNLRNIVEMLMRFVAKALKERQTIDGTGIQNAFPPMSAVVRENAVTALRQLATEEYVQIILEKV